MLKNEPLRIFHLVASASVMTMMIPVAGFVMLFPGFAVAAQAVGHGAVPHLDGADLGLLWVVPFAGILLSIALFPLLAPNIWHHHFGKISAFWALSF